MLKLLILRANTQYQKLQYILPAIMIVYLFVMGVLIWKEKQKARLWTAGYLEKEKLTDRLYAIIYYLLKSIPVTRDYIDKLSYQFKLISPCNSKLIARKTVRICFIISTTNVLTLLFLFSFNPRIITLITVMAAILICNNEIVGRSARNFEIQLDQELQHLIEYEIHNYYVNYRVDDALYLSMDNLSLNMQVAADQIYQLLLSDDREQALTEYYENVPNKYLREFVSLCVGVAERGDEEINNKSLFVRNMENLYSQLEIEIEKLQRLKMEFAGVTLIVILPIFCIDLVKWFCISLKENMLSFYYGKSGFLIDISLLLITSIIYVIMHKSADYVTFHQSTHRWLYFLDKLSLIKRAMNNYCDKYATKLERLKRKLKNNGYNIKPRHFILRSFLLSFVVFILIIGIFAFLNFDRKQSLLKANLSDVATLTSAATDKQYDKMAILIEAYMNDYVMAWKEGSSDNYPNTQEELFAIISREEGFTNTLINEALAKEISRRVQMYNTADMSTLDMIVGILLSIIAYFVPDALLRYTASVSKDSMEDEVNQFHALIGILMYDKSMTVKRILMEMESYAYVFKSSLRNCINDYGSGDVQALKQLKEDEPYGPFARIVDNLIRCDDMPIYEAFHEIDVERDGYLSKRKLANERTIRKRVVRAYLLAAVPLILLFAYGIVPTLLAAVDEITDTMESISGVV